MTSVDQLDRLVSAEHSRIGEFCLRIVGAALQILATWAIVTVLPPEEAGVYFRGFVIALGLGTLLRGKYEITMAQHIIRHGVAADLSTGVLLLHFSRRLLVRATVVCAVLLVVTADLDIQAPQLQAVLQTYLPFVLAVPFVSLMTFLAESLRAANRTLGIVLAACAINISMLLAVLLVPANAPLAFYSWAFLLGSILAAAAGAMLARRAFPVSAAERSRPMPHEMLQVVDAREFVGLGRGILLWGPLCVLAVWAPPLEMAQYAVAARTALLVDFFLPALNLTDCHAYPAMTRPAAGTRGRLARQLATSLVASSALVVPLLLLATLTLRLYGQPYASQWIVYMLLLGSQWLNGFGRPAMRQSVVEWDSRRIGRAVGSGAVAVVLICALGVNAFGAQAAAFASLVGAAIVNGRAILLALR